MRGLGRAMLTGAIIGTVVMVVVVAVGFVASNRAAARSDAEAERVLLILTWPGSEGQAAVVTAIDVIDVTSRPPSVEVLDPDLPVTLPGTSFERLRDAYPLGGGSRVAEAYARAEGEATLAYVEVTAEAWSRLVAGAGGVKIDVPLQLDVFDGKQLYSFAPGRGTFDASELAALALAAERLKPADGERLRRQLGESLAEVVIAHADELGEMAVSGLLRSDRSSTALDRLGSRLTRE